MASFYDLKKATNEPVSDLLEATLALNFHLCRALEAGWEVKLIANEAGDNIRVEIAREEWPTTLDDERVAK